MTSLLAGIMKKKTKIIIGSSIAVCAFGICGGFFITKNTYQIKKDVFVTEYGETLNRDKQTYIQANKSVLSDLKIDFQDVNTEKVGKYKAKVTFRNKEKTFQVEVRDTIKPVVTLKKEIRGVAGKELSAADIIDKAEDKAGIKKISFQEGQSGEASADAGAVKLFYEVAGEYENTVFIEDNHGNKTKQKFTICITEDYESHVFGIQDLTVEQDSSVDWVQNIQKDEKIAEVLVDASGVNLSVPGEYELKYTIVGDDQKTTIEKTVKVTVTEKPKQEVAVSGGSSGKQNNRDDSYDTGNSNNHSSDNSGGNFSGGSSSSDDSGNSGSGNDFTPGQGWGGTQTDEGYIDGGSEESGGNTGQSGTWNPWG